MKRFAFKAVGLLLCCVAEPTLAAASVALGMFDLVARADIVFEGTVVGLVGYSRGAGVRSPEVADTVAPLRVQAAVAVDRAGEGEEEASGRDAPAAPRLARGAGIGGGEMLFTEVTLAVDRPILGAPGETVTFTVAGGVVEGREVVVSGMPRFALGERYALFLRPGFEATANPIVGVGQGCFRIVADAATGTDRILDARGNLVIGVANGELAVRRDRDGAPGTALALEAPPRPADPNAKVRTGVSAEFARYWLSDAPAMSADAFASAVRSLAEARQ